MEKVKENINSILLGLSIIAVTFITINLIEYLDDSLTVVSILDITTYGLSLTSGLILLFNAIKKQVKISHINIAALFLLSSVILDYSYDSSSIQITIIPTLSHLAMLVISVSAMVLYALSIKNKKLEFISKVFLLIEALLVLLNVFTGSSYAVGLLAIYSIIFVYGIAYKENKGELGNEE